MELFEFFKGALPVLVSIVAIAVAWGQMREKAKSQDREIARNAEDIKAHTNKLDQHAKDIGDLKDFFRDILDEKMDKLSKDIKDYVDKSK